MEFNDYQQISISTAVYPGQHGILGLVYTALGAAGEAGEYANKVKKVLRDNNPNMAERTQALVEELGDALWYLAACADELGVTLDDVAQRNIKKLASRKERGVIHGDGDNR